MYMCIRRNTSIHFSVTQSFFSAFLICIREGITQVKYSPVSFLVFICEPEYKLCESQYLVSLIRNIPSLCNRYLLDKWVNKSVWDDETQDLGSLWEFQGLLVQQGERASQTCLMISLTCGIGKHPFSLEILSQWPSGRPGDLSLLMYCCCGLGQMLQVVLSLRTPNPKRISFCLLKHYLHGRYKHLQIPQDWQPLSTATFSSRKPVHYAGLQQEMELCPSTSADFSMGLRAPQSCTWSFQSHISPLTPTLYEGASVSAKWMNDGTNSNMGKTSKPGSCEERKCFINLRFGLYVVAY